jgi:exodeoxyribonuclease VIII
VIQTTTAPAKETNEEYHSGTDGRVSNSWLNDLEESPQNFHAIHIAKTLPKPEPSPAMMLGHLVHTTTLEPHAVYERYAVAPKVDRRTNAGKAAFAEFEAESEGKEVVTVDDMTTAIGCATALLRNETLAPFFNARSLPIKIEERINFEVAGLPMRCKPDWLCVDLGLIIDLKTTRHTKRSQFERSVESLGYHRQSWLYREAAQQKYGKAFRFLFAVVHTSAPFETACYELDEKGNEDGRLDAIALIEQFKLRQRTNNWLADQSQGSAPTKITTSRWHKAPAIETELYEDESEAGNE